MVKDQQNEKINKIKYGNDIEKEVKNNLIQKKKLIKEKFLQNKVLTKLEYEKKIKNL